MDAPTADSSLAGDAPTGGIRLVTRADDAGSFEAANRAIRDGFETGIVRNTSVMAPGGQLADAAERLAGVDGLCTGVHLTLTSEWDSPRWEPVTSPDAVPTLVQDDGAFWPTSMELHEAEPTPEALRMEVEAQLEAVRTAGFEPAYIDAHMGVNWVGDLEAILADIREREGLLDGDDIQQLPAVETAQNDPAGLRARLEAAAPGTYLQIGHPCYDTEAIRAVTGSGFGPGELATAREAEREMFSADAIRTYCATHDVQPISLEDV